MAMLSDYPQIFSEWNYAKNSLNPKNIFAGSGKKVWWICDKGHEWESAVYSRTRNIKSQCPYCSHQTILPGYNDLSTTNPELLKYWDYNKNIIQPSEIFAGGSTKIWWLCSEGHSFEKNIGFMKNNQSCKYCSGKELLPGYNDLATLHKELLQQWDYDRNTEKPFNILGNSNKKYWWKCTHKHSWKVSLSNILRGSGCPYCSGKKVLQGFNDLETVFPSIAKQWHPTKNEDMFPTHITSKSGKKVWWLGKDCHHEWQSTIYSRTRDKTIGCPYCAGQKTLKGFNDLATVNPNIIKTWNFNKNIIKPTEITSKSGKKVWWICDNEHEWKATVYNITNGTGCPICLLNSRISKKEKQLQQFIQQNFSEYHIKTSDRTLIKPYELDIYIPELKLAIEFNGTYWHSDKTIFERTGMSAKTYHTMKYDLCQKNNVKLLFVWEHDWDKNKINLQKSLSNILLGENYDYSLFMKFE